MKTSQRVLVATDAWAEVITVVTEEEGVGVVMTREERTRAMGSERLTNNQGFIGSEEQ